MYNKVGVARRFGAAALLVAASQASAALTINATYLSTFNTDATWKATAKLAKAAWETALADTVVNYTVDVTFTDADLSGEGAGLIARMRDNTQMAANNATTGTKLPTAGVVEMNTKNIAFYMDDDVTNNDENFVMGVTGLVSQAQKAAKRFDGFSIMLHEIGHVLGYSGTTGMWNDAKPFTAYTDFANNIAGGKFKFDYLTSGLEGSINGPITQWNTDTFHMTAAAQSGRNMAPTFGFGERRALTALDVESVCDAFRLCPVPTPGATTLFAGSGLLALRRRRSVA